MTGVDQIRTLLLVEDNPAEADLIQEYLLDGASRPPRVVHVTNLADAVAAAYTTDADAVLLDLHLPDGAGVDCVNAIRLVDDHVPIVVLTGLDNDEVALECIAAGAQDYISKQEARSTNLNRAIGYAIARVGERRNRALAETLHQQLAAIVEASSDGIVSCSVEGVIESWNRGAETIFGYSRDEAVGRHVSQVIRPLDETGAQEQQTIFARVANDVADNALEIERLTKDGRLVVLSVVTCRLRGQDEEGGAIAAIYRDVTEKKRSEDELRRRNEDLVSRDRLMRALTARLNAVREHERVRISREVHDELGQLLTGLKMDLRWMERRLKGEPAPAAALQAKVMEAERPVDGTIQTVQRIATELRPSALDALGLPAAIRDETRRFEARTGVVATVLVKEEAPAGSDKATALFRIFQEILTNAARHARAKALHVALDCSNDELVLNVRDDGVGFRPDEAILTSLGLLGMRERAAELGGSFDIASAMGQGTAVTVRIPR
ncbi:PAS domain S-box protein [Phenylobacterium sp.]|uniref:PAS domain S-box protein n=1 Tax=Phenylobacterium sp. TaxID=1871053 RepID=UPI0035B4985F